MKFVIIQRDTTAQRRNLIQWTMWMQLDELVLLSHSQQLMQYKTFLLRATSTQIGHNMQKEKTKILKLNTSIPEPITPDGEPLEVLGSFICLDSIINSQGGTDADVTAQIGKAKDVLIKQ